MFQYELGDSVFSCVVLRKLSGKHTVVSKLMAAKKEHVPGICLVGEAKSFSVSYSTACPHQLPACCSVRLHDKGHCEGTTRGKLRAVRLLRNLVVAWQKVVSRDPWHFYTLLSW